MGVTPASSPQPQLHPRPTAVFHGTPLSTWPTASQPHYLGVQTQETRPVSPGCVGPPEPTFTVLPPSRTVLACDPLQPPDPAWLISVPGLESLKDPNLASSHYLGGWRTKAGLKCSQGLGVVVHSHNPSMEDTEAGRLLVQS